MGRLVPVGLNIKEKLKDHTYAVEFVKAQDELIDRLRRKIRKLEKRLTTPKEPTP